jgi:hypothetical protein
VPTYEAVIAIDSDSEVVESIVWATDDEELSLSMSMTFEDEEVEQFQFDVDVNMSLPATSEFGVVMSMPASFTDDDVEGSMSMPFDATEDEEEIQSTQFPTPAFATVPKTKCNASKCSIELSPDLLMEYSVNVPDGVTVEECDGCTMSVKLSYRGTAWIGFGFSTDVAMVGSEAVM